MMEFNFIELVAFGIISFLVISAALIAILLVCKWISDYMDASTPLVRHDIKSQLESALGKKE